MRIRTFDAADRAAVVALWQRAGLVRPWNDPDRDIDRKLADSPWGLIVGETEPDGNVIGSAMVGYDGHRGSVFYLAVDPRHRGRGHGTALMEHAERLLLARGCPKVNVSVRAENRGVIGFYLTRGYRLEGESYAVTMGLRLVEDGPAPDTTGQGER